MHTIPGPNYFCYYCTLQRGVSTLVDRPRGARVRAQQRQQQRTDVPIL